VLLGAVLVYFMFPRRDDERRLLASYEAEDAGQAPASTAPEQKSLEPVS
jgi:hypothetical protein